MEEKAQERLHRLELARHLEALARELRDGRLAAAGKTWKVPEEVVGKLQVREKKGRLVVKAKFAWETLAEYHPEAREPVVRWQESLKSVKLRLSARFKELQQAALSGALPDPALLQAFAEASRAMAQMSEPEWEEAMAAYMAHVEALERAVKAGDAEALRHELADLRTAMITCHREFK